MTETIVAITYKEEARGVRVACLLTGDPQIDNGLRYYLVRTGFVINRVNTAVEGSQMFTVMCTSTMSVSEILEAISAYYISWGKEPSIRPVSEIIR